ncbi:hypothetical protein NHX12_021974 [Muraenolepis orangiensis]|uniref:Uncharacterized protein n=1 Tax=Muraenolepis orangiensis TaxID=630683 RepID=A0A9Q0ITJ2_9TELE|nr:hypothetical protein NHX12_021974 [Muraenolepis orangiensis]
MSCHGSAEAPVSYYIQMLSSGRQRSVNLKPGQDGPAGQRERPRWTNKGGSVRWRSVGLQPVNSLLGRWLLNGDTVCSAPPVVTF